MRVYLASPLGFADSTRAFMDHLMRELASDAVELVNPWDKSDDNDALRQAMAIPHHDERVAAMAAINHRIAAWNEAAIRSSDAVVAVLDGVDVDSGTASEIGFAYALGKRVIGLRTDFRLAGDNLGAVVNLQVQHFIDASGGRIVRDVAALRALLDDGNAASIRP